MSDVANHPSFDEVLSVPLLAAFSSDSSSSREFNMFAIDKHDVVSVIGFTTMVVGYFFWNARVFYSFFASWDAASASSCLNKVLLSSVEFEFWHKERMCVRIL